MKKKKKKTKLGVLVQTVPPKFERCKQEGHTFKISGSTEKKSTHPVSAICVSYEGQWAAWPPVSSQKGKIEKGEGEE